MREKLIEKPIGGALGRELTGAPGSRADVEIDAFIERRHDKRAQEEGERPAEEAWRDSERRAAAKREQERYYGTLVAEKHLRDVYFRRFQEKDRIVSELEGRK